VIEVSPADIQVFKIAIARLKFTMTKALLAAYILASAANIIDSSMAAADSDSSDASCVTTVTDSTTLGASLVQALSARTRLNAERMKEDKNIFEVRAVPGSEAKRNASPPKSAGAASAQDGFASDTKITKAMAGATSLMQQGQTFGRSAIDRLVKAPLRSVAAASTGAMFVGFVLLVAFGAVTFMMIFHPGMFAGNQRSMPNSDDAQRKDSGLLGRSTNGTRPYFPMNASPQLSIRGLRSSPETSKKQLPTDSRLSPGGVKGLSPALGTDDDEGAPKSMKSGTSAEARFCPDLVVPQHCECILVLPLDLGSSRSIFPVTDVNGSLVLRAVPQHSTGGPWRATITTSTGETLVQCCEARQQGAWNEAEFHLLRGGGQFFAKLVYSVQQDRYLLTLQNGSILHFWGNFDNKAVNITDDENRLLGTTEVGSTDFDPEGTYCRLRVAPLADVGLALCGLLCIGQHMANQRNRASR